MEIKKFTKNDASFHCAHCGKEVLPLGFTSRNHCPYCLYSLHVDNHPGDRMNPCGGLMEPIRAYPDAKKGYVIVHRCLKCHEERQNRAAHTAKVQPDDINLIIQLTVKPF